MTRLLLPLSLTLLCACSPTRRLSDQEFDHYYALRPYMTEDQEKSFLKLKLEEERTEYLKGLGLWDDFYSMPDSVREAVLDGEVAIGWTRKMLVMSLGWPYDQQKVVGNTSALRTERFIYRFEQHADGTIFVWTEKSKTEQKATRLFRREIVLADDRVMEITEKENW